MISSLNALLFQVSSLVYCSNPLQLSCVGAAEPGMPIEPMAEYSILKRKRAPPHPLGWDRKALFRWNAFVFWTSNRLKRHHKLGVVEPRSSSAVYVPIEHPPVVAQCLQLLVSVRVDSRAQIHQFHCPGKTNDLQPASSLVAHLHFGS